jgi:hypothetical protein
MAKDLFHDTVKRALEKEGWEITDDPLEREYIIMDKLEKYREIIIEILTDFSKRKPMNMLEMDVQIIIDKENDHYFLYDVGWNELERIHDCVFHFDIIKDKVWLQEDNTNVEVALLLVEKGVPKSDIVLGFQPPYKRQYTEFAAA